MHVRASEQLDLVFQALANPVRRSILDTISEGERNVVGLAAPHAMSLNAVSKHIKCLERAGLVTRRVDGNYHRIAMNHNAMSKAAAWLSYYVPLWRGSLKSLKTHMESK